MILILQSSTGPETNIESIRALDEQIEEGKGDTIKLKRARNSLLNISTRVSPEVLGNIFFWIVARNRNHSLTSGTHFGGLEKGSHNFLLVCHRWFEVASNIPELWSLWGNTLEDWNRRCHRSGDAPADLVLDGNASHPEGALNTPLQNALRDRVTEDKVRQIHLRCDNLNLLAFIFSSLIPERDARPLSVESIILWTTKTIPELSNFFARSRLPNLRYLHIIGMLQTPLWDHLTLSQTTRLTTLSLRLAGSSHLPTTSQLRSILNSNPNLRELELSDAALPDETDESEAGVSLQHLKTIALAGKSRRVLGLLRWLELPAALDYFQLSLDHPTVEEDVSQTVGQYMRGHLQRDIRFQGRLAVASFRGYVDICVGQAGNQPEHPPWPERPSTRFTVSIIAQPQDPLTKQLTLDLVALVPRERVVSFKTEYALGVPEELFVTMPNIETLCLHDAVLADGFLQPTPDGPHANTKLFPSLRSLLFWHVNADNTGWDPLTTYLAHQTSGGQTISIELMGYCSYLPPRVAKQIRGQVEKFVYDPITDVGDSDEDENEGDEDYDEDELEGGEDDVE